MQLSDGIQPETEVIVPGIAIAFIPGNRFKLLGDRILNKNCHNKRGGGHDSLPYSKTAYHCFALADEKYRHCAKKQYSDFQTANLCFSRKFANPEMLFQNEYAIIDP